MQFQKMCTTQQRDSKTMHKCSSFLHLFLILSSFRFDKSQLCIYLIFCCCFDLFSPFLPTIVPLEIFKYEINSKHTQTPIRKKNNSNCMNHLMKLLFLLYRKTAFAVLDIAVEWWNSVSCFFLCAKKKLKMNH